MNKQELNRLEMLSSQTSWKLEELMEMDKLYRKFYERFSQKTNDFWCKACNGSGFNEV